MTDYKHKMNVIIYQIQNGISEIDNYFRKGPSLYFYQRAAEVRKSHYDLESILQDKDYLELLYATLVSWNMDSRAAKMKYYDDFCDNILSCTEVLKAIDEYAHNGKFLFDAVSELLAVAYQSLSLMESGGKLVSNSKLLHFLFPEMLMPMDRRNTLNFFYRNTGESMNKYLEIIKLSFEIIAYPLNWNTYLDSKWNVTRPKIIDNAIILINGEDGNI